MTSDRITLLLAKWSKGDRAAFEELAPAVYHELHKIAQSYLRRERAGHTLQPTALVNEAYLKLVNQQGVDWQSRTHFFGIAAQAMRRILVDYARGHLREKRGGGVQAIPLDDAIDVTGGRAAELVALDDALDALARLDPQQGRVVELRFFAGLSIEETAAVLGVSRATVDRAWAVARAWLARELTRGT
jgi:RNA polymerase sigma factor (TIGR02999 family)